MRLEGPAVHDAQRGFLKNWAELGPPVPDSERAGLFPDPTITPGGPAVRFVQHRPDEDGDEHTTNLHLHAIRSAEESITLENAYFVPPPEIREALIAAARRGVDVKVMTNSYASNDMGVVSDAGRYFYDDLIAAGVQIYEKQGGTLHSKTATFDGQFSIVGSVNMNGRSDELDSESALAIMDPGTARRLEQRFADGVAETQQVTREELQDEGFFTNLRQWSLSLFAWTF
jgi:cardiolipin synthase